MTAPAACTLAALVAAALSAAASAQADPVPGQVVSATVIDGSAGSVLAGKLQEHDNFGTSVAILGDVDGDGIDDLAVGAPGDDDGSHSPLQGNVGAVWILFCNASGGVKSAQKISAEEGGFTGLLHIHDLFGTSVSALRDLDGDARLDLAVGAPGDDDGGTDCGAIWILLLESDGTVKSHRKISDLSGSFSGEIDPFDRFGISLALLGDLAGDGTTELAVGAQSDDDGGEFFDGPGAVWILSLFGDSQAVEHVKISKFSGTFPGDIVDGDQFGCSVASLGDVNDDGVNDMLVGAPGDDTAGPESGALWLVMLQASGEVLDAVRVTEGLHGLTGSLKDHELFGTSLALADDLDSDGRREAFVGSPLAGPPTGTTTGGFRMISPQADGLVGNTLFVSNGLGGMPGALGFDHFGNGLAYLGDHDDDGRPCLAVGAPLDDVGTLQHGGSVWLLDLHLSPFEVAGPGLAGAGGEPVLKPGGPLSPGSVLHLDLFDSKALAPAMLFAGLDALNAHFKGGVLVPSPDLVFLHTTDIAGAIDFGGPWPPGLPGGVTFYAQYWVLDATGPKGFTSSQAVKGTSVGP